MDNEPAQMIRFDVKDHFYIYLMSFIGKPYIYGGNQPGIGADCSGAVIEWLGFLGIDVGRDRTSQDLFYWARERERMSATGIGSMAFYGSGINSIEHVAMMIDSYRVIEFGGGDETTKTEEDAKKRGACCRVRQLAHRKDLRGVISLKELPWRKRRESGLSR